MTRFLNVGFFNILCDCACDPGELHSGAMKNEGDFILVEIELREVGSIYANDLCKIKSFLAHKFLGRDILDLVGWIGKYPHFVPAEKLIKLLNFLDCSLFYWFLLALPYFFLIIIADDILE